MANSAITRQITLAEASVTEAQLAAGATLKLGTERASTSGTSIDFTGIPAGTKMILIHFVGVSTNGSSIVVVQLGDAGGIETSGYLGAAGISDVGGAAGTTSTANFKTTTTGAWAPSSIMHGTMMLTLEDSSDFTWCCSGVFGRSDDGTASISGGSKSLSAELDRVRITTVNGTDTFDAGSINIAYK